MRNSQKKKIREVTFNSLKEGDSESFEVVITDKLIASFAKFSGDHNPLHCDSSYAAQTESGRIVAHGMIIGALFSRLIGAYLPGKYSLYLSQNLEFRKPIFAGMNIIIEGKITQKVEGLKIVKINTMAYSAASRKILVSGEALVKLLK